MASQFFHIETFGQTGKNNTIVGIIGEAMREVGYASHIAAPGAPTMVYGTLEGVAEELAERYATGKDKRGQRVRKDAHLLLAGVAGYPTPMNSKAWADPEERARYDRWKALLFEMLRKEFGDRLRAVILHEDEAFPHIHFYVIPEGNSLTEIHRGNAAKAAEPDKKKQMTAYKAAMSGWQDDYFEKVGMMSGFSRLGPGRRRLTQQEWKEEKVANRLASDCHARQHEAVTKDKKRVRLAVAAVERDKEALDKAWLDVAAEKEGKKAPVQEKPVLGDTAQPTNRPTNQPNAAAAVHDPLAKFGL